MKTCSEYLEISPMDEIHMEDQNHGLATDGMHNMQNS